MTCKKYRFRTQSGEIVDNVDQSSIACIFGTIKGERFRWNKNGKSYHNDFYGELIYDSPNAVVNAAEKLVSCWKKESKETFDQAMIELEMMIIKEKIEKIENK